MKTLTMNTLARPLLVTIVALAPLVGCDKKAETPSEAQADAKEEAQEKAEEKSEEKIEAVKEGEVAAGTAMNVSGEVDSKVSPKAFKLEAMNDLWGDKVLVLSKEELNVTEGATVKVDGVVQKLVIADVERELGWDLEPQLEVEYSEKNIIVAKSVTVIEPAAK